MAVAQQRQDDSVASASVRGAPLLTTVSSLVRREAFGLKVAAAVLIYRPDSDLFIRVEKPAFQKAVWITLAVWLSGLSACL